MTENKRKTIIIFYCSVHLAIHVACITWAMVKTIATFCCLLWLISLEIMQFRLWSPVCHCLFVPFFQDVQLLWLAPQLHSPRPLSVVAAVLSSELLFPPFQFSFSLFLQLLLKFSQFSFSLFPLHFVLPFLVSEKIQQEKNVEASGIMQIIATTDTTLLIHVYRKVLTTTPLSTRVPIFYPLRYH